MIKPDLTKNFVAPHQPSVSQSRIQPAGIAHATSSHVDSLHTVKLNTTKAVSINMNAKLPSIALPNLTSNVTHREALSSINIFYLPTTVSGFCAFLFVLVLLSISMSLHVVLSSQIWSRGQDLRQLEQQYTELKEKNAELIYQVNQNVTLAEVHAEAMQIGYEPMTERRFVIGDHMLVNILDEQAIAEAMRRSQ